MITHIDHQQIAKRQTKQHNNGLDTTLADTNKTTTQKLTKQKKMKACVNLAQMVGLNSEIV